LARPTIRHARHRSRRHHARSARHDFTFAGHRSRAVDVSIRWARFSADRRARQCRERRFGLTRRQRTGKPGNGESRTENGRSLQRTAHSRFSVTRLLRFGLRAKPASGPEGRGSTKPSHQDLTELLLATPRTGRLKQTIQEARVGRAPYQSLISGVGIMFRKLVGALSVMSLLVGLVAADEFNAIIKRWMATRSRSSSSTSRTSRKTKTRTRSPKKPRCRSPRTPDHQGHAQQGRQEVRSRRGDRERPEKMRSSPRSKKRRARARSAAAVHARSPRPRIGKTITAIAVMQGKGKKRRQKG